MRIKEKTPRDFYNNKDPRLNISKSQFFKLRRGEDYPQIETILKMAKVLGIDANELTKHDAEEEGAKLYKEAARKSTQTSYDAKEQLEDFESVLDCIIDYQDDRERRERIKFAVICVCGFIAVSAWFAMLFVALQS